MNGQGKDFESSKSLQLMSLSAISTISYTSPYSDLEMNHFEEKEYKVCKSADISIQHRQIYAVNSLTTCPSRKVKQGLMHRFKMGSLLQNVYFHRMDVPKLFIKVCLPSVVLDYLNSVYSLRDQTYTPVHASGKSRHSDSIIFPSSSISVSLSSYYGISSLANFNDIKYLSLPLL